MPRFYMKPRRKPLSLLIALAALSFSTLYCVSYFVSSKAGRDSSRTAEGVTRSQNPAAQSNVVDAYLKLPLSFEENKGQTDARVSFMSRGDGYALFLTPAGATLSLRKPKGMERGAGAGDKASVPAVVEASRRSYEVLEMRVVGGNPSPQVRGEEPLQGKTSYFTGDDSRRWLSGVSSFAKVKYEAVYPGIDLVYYGNQRQLEYDFIVSPGADPDRINLSFNGVRQLYVDEGGELVLKGEGGEVRQHRPVIYQEINGERQDVPGHYVVHKDGAVGFDVGEYDRSRPLVIDPVLVYSTFLGGNDFETGGGIVVDSAGNTYVAGSTASSNFPTANPLQGSIGEGAFTLDLFVAKLNAAGSAFVFSTYIGGPSDDICNDIALDSSGNVYLAGSTFSSAFPLVNPIQSSKGGGSDAFALKLSSDGSALLYSTYLGGTTGDQALDVAVDSGGSALLTGNTASKNFPTTAGAFQTTKRGAPLFRSDDGGVNLSVSDNGFTGSRIIQLVIDPVTTSKVYAVTDAGIFRSTDGGDNWSAVNNGLSASQVHQVVIDPTNTARLYAVTPSGLFRSTDGASSWSAVETGLSPSLFSMTIDAANPSVLYVGNSGGTIAKSIDGGSNWSRVLIASNFPSINAIVVDPSNSSIVYAATSRGIYKSTNAGTNWTGINNGLQSSFVTVNRIVIDPTNPSTLYASTINGFYRTVNGGTNWSLVSSLQTINTLIISPLSSSTLYAGTASGLFKSTDSAATWSPLSTAAVSAVAVDPSNALRLYTGGNTGTDIFLAKIAPQGSSLSYSTLIGGDGIEQGNGIALDASGYVYLAGSTTSTDFFVLNALQPLKKSSSEGFVIKFDPALSGPVYSTYLGGDGADSANGLAIDGQGNILLAGNTTSPNFPTANALQPNKFDDANATDVFVAKLKGDGTQLFYSTYLGGNRADTASDIAVDSKGNAYITGTTASYVFPALYGEHGSTNGQTDAFVLKLNPSGSALIFTKFMAGAGNEAGLGVAVDSAGNAYAIGTTTSVGFATVNPIQATYGANTDLFVVKIAEAADLAVSIEDSPDPLAFGQNLTYTINVQNSGELDATGVTLNVALPAGATLVSATPGQGTCSGSTQLTCNLGNVLSGGATTVTVIVTPPAIKTINATASVTLNEPDSNTANNSSAQSTTVNFADISVLKSSPHDQAAPGASLSYMITVSNNSGSTADTVTLTDVLPAETTFVSCAVVGGACSGSANNRTVTISSLQVGKSVTVVMTVKVNDSMADNTVISNTATVSSPLPDSNPNNNSSTAAVKVASTPLRIKNNGKIVFGSDRNFTNSTQPSGIYLINSNGTGEMLFPGIPVNSYSSYPSWSSDGQKLAYRYVNHNNPFGSSPIYEIRVAGADGSGSITVAQNGSSRGGRIAWSPDSKRLVYVGNDGFFYMVNADGTGVSKLPGTPAGATDVDWSPDGSRFVYSDTVDIWLMNLDGSGLKNLTAGHPSAETMPRWSPDGTRILCTSNGTAFVMNSDGTGFSRLLNQQGANQAAWSPDGTKIVAEVGNSLYVFEVDGSSSTRITNNGFYNGHPDWQPMPTNIPLVPQPSGQTFSISGKLTLSANGSPMTWVNVNLSGTRAATLIPNSDGSYSFTGLPAGGNYTVSVSDPAWDFSPPSRTFNNLSSNQTGADFVATYIPANISGRVTDTNGAPLANVEMVSSGGFPTGKTYTDSNGYYIFPNVSRIRTYTIYPNTYMGPYTFQPPVQVFGLLNESKTANFVGTKNPAHTISGRVTDAVTGAGVSGARLTLATDNSFVVAIFTDSNGYYTFGEKLAGRNYEVYVDGSSGSYDYPTHQASITNLSSNQTVNFSGRKRGFYHISGKVSDTQGQPIEGVTITMSGSQSGTATTDGTGNYSLGNVAMGGNYTVTPAKANYAFTAANLTFSNLSSDQTANFTGTTSGAIQLSQSSYSFNEGMVNTPQGFSALQISVTRTDTTSSATVQYSTSDASGGNECNQVTGQASQRCDYGAQAGTLRFAAGEASKTIQIPIVNDGYWEGDEAFKISLSNPTGGAVIGANNQATITIQDRGGVTSPVENPYLNNEFFVRMNYLDFLAREPDAEGWNTWTGVLNNCGPEKGFLGAPKNCDRAFVSHGFIASAEFTDRGYRIYRMYEVALSRLPRYSEFVPDMAAMSGAPGSAELEQNTTQFADSFTSRQEFINRYGDVSAPVQAALFIARLEQNAGVALPATTTTLPGQPPQYNRQDLINLRANGTLTLGQTLRAFVEQKVTYDRFFERGFVTMQYFGFLRRDPDLNDPNLLGWTEWVFVFTNGGAARNRPDILARDIHHLTFGFIYSEEYRKRFGQP